MAKETAEQKLLKLIETTDAQDGGGAAPAPSTTSAEALRVLDSVKGVNDSSLAIPSFIGQLMSALKDPALLFKLITSIGVKDLNKVLIVGMVGIAAFFAMDFSRGMKMSGRQVHFAIPENVKEISESVFPVFKGITEYVEIVSRRNIFHPFERKVEEKEEDVPEEVKAVQRVTEKTKDLKLVGVSWESTQESAEAMIEDTISGVTYFLKSGENVQGVTVKHIYSDGVTVIYENQEMDMRL